MPVVDSAGLVSSRAGSLQPEPEWPGPEWPGLA